MTNQEMVARLENIRDLYPWGEDSYETLDYAIRAVVELPKRRKEAKRWRAKARQPKTGHWILDETDNSITCDKCGCLIWANDISNGEAYYCPNCGCRMVEPQESEEE